MKQSLLFIIVIIALLSAGCKKDPVAAKGPVPIGTTNSTSYFPVTTGSSWKYLDDNTGFTFNITINDTTTTLLGNTYHNAQNITQSFYKFDEEYFYAGNHVFATQFSDDLYGPLNLQVLNDTMAVGHSWIGPASTSGTINGYTSRAITTIKEKGIDYSIYGVKFSNVIHTQVALQYYIGGTGLLYGTIDFYFAPGVGIIQSYFYLNQYHSETRNITGYDIK